MLLELEEQHGNGHCADCKELLDTAPGYLNERVDLETVRRILVNAKTQCRAALGAGKERDNYRQSSNHQRMVRALEALAQRALESYCRQPVHGVPRGRTPAG